jgi:hypothetical protein
MRATEKKFAVDGRAIEVRIDFVKVVVTCCELIGEEIGKRYDLGRCILSE